MKQKVAFHKTAVIAKALGGLAGAGKSYSDVATLGASGAAKSTGAAIIDVLRGIGKRFWGRNPEGKWITKTPYKQIASTVGVAGAATLPWSWYQARSLKDKTPLPELEPGFSAKTPSVLLGAGTGGSVAGLGSFLYGKLKDRPDLRRDLIAAALGSIVGGSYQLLKSGSAVQTQHVTEVQAWKNRWAEPTYQDKEAIGYLKYLAPAGRAAWGGLKWTGRKLSGNKVLVGATGALMGTDLYTGRQEKKRHRAAMGQGKQVEKSYGDLSRNVTRTRRGVIGSVLGGAMGGALSRIFGGDKDNIRRDLVAILAGMGIGGLVGTLPFNKLFRR